MTEELFLEAVQLTCEKNGRVEFPMIPPKHWERTVKRLLKQGYQVTDMTPVWTAEQKAYLEGRFAELVNEHWENG
jgi:hypothetical protein